jgi:hypothetical protein
MLLASNPAPLAAIVVTVFDSATTRTVNAPVAVADSATVDPPDPPPAVPRYEGAASAKRSSRVIVAFRVVNRVDKLFAEGILAAAIDLIGKFSPAAAATPKPTVAVVVFVSDNAAPPIIVVPVVPIARPELSRTAPWPEVAETVNDSVFGARIVVAPEAFCGVTV